MRAIARVRMYAKELVDLQPDVILADTTPVIAALQQPHQHDFSTIGATHRANITMARR
jgi:hypothetical protein